MLVDDGNRLIPFQTEQNSDIVVVEMASTKSIAPTGSINAAIAIKFSVVSKLLRTVKTLMKHNDYLLIQPSVNMFVSHSIHQHWSAHRIHQDCDM